MIQVVSPQLLLISLDAKRVVRRNHFLYIVSVDISSRFGRATYLELRRRALKDPRAGLVCGHVTQPRACAFGREDRVTEEDELAVAPSVVGGVVWCERRIAPYRVAALSTKVERINMGGRPRRGKATTFIHMLALPAQLLKSRWRSRREKKRSRTWDESFSASNGRGGRWEAYRMHQQGATVLCLSSRLRGRPTWPSPREAY